MGLTHLLVIVPGIGGSVLERVDGRPLWGQSLATMARSAFDPVGLAISEPVVPVGLLPTVSVLPWMKVAGYDQLVRHLLNTFRLGPSDIDTARLRSDPLPDASVLLFLTTFAKGWPTTPTGSGSRSTAGWATAE